MELLIKLFKHFKMILNKDKIISVGIVGMYSPVILFDLIQ